MQSRSLSSESSLSTYSFYYLLPQTHTINVQKYSFKKSSTYQPISQSIDVIFYFGNKPINTDRESDRHEWRTKIANERERETLLEVFQAKNDTEQHLADAEYDGDLHFERVEPRDLVLSQLPRLQPTTSTVHRLGCDTTEHNCYRQLNCVR